MLPWLGLLLLIGCVAELLRTASPPGLHPPAAGGSRNASATVSPSVILDAGHGGADTGAVANGLAEKDLTLDLARRVAAVLEGRGIASRLTREDDRYVPLATRARVANASPRAIFVSIHLNHAATGASGIETFYSQQKEPLLPPPLSALAPARLWRWVAWLGGGGAPGERSGTPAVDQPFSLEGGQTLADCIQTALVASTSAANRGVKERALYVTRHVQAPAVLVEGGFLSNPAEARQLTDPAYRQRLAGSIADGVSEYLRSARRRPRSRAEPRGGVKSNR